MLQAGDVSVRRRSVTLCHVPGCSAVYKHSSKGFLMKYRFPLFTVFMHRENHEVDILEGEQVKNL